MEGDEGSFDLSQEEAPTQMWEPEEEPEGDTAMEVPPSRAEEEEEDGGSHEGGGQGQQEKQGGNGSSGEPEEGEGLGGDDMVMAEEEDEDEEGEQARLEEGDENLEEEEEEEGESEQMMAEGEEEPETMDPLLALLDGQQKQQQEQQRLKQQQQEEAAAIASKKKAGRAPPSKSAWMFYLQQNKDQVKKDQPGLKITQVFKVLAERWKDLSEDDKQVYHDMAQQDKERALLQQQQQQEASAIGGEAGSAAMEVEGGRGLSTDLHLPLAAIRRIMKLDPEVKTVAKDAALLVAKATELFLETLGEETLRVAQASRRKALKPEDVASGMRRKDRLAFLRPDFPLDTTTSTAAKKTGTTNKKPAALPVATGQKGIEAFYSKKRQASSAEDGEEQDDEPN